MPKRSLVVVPNPFTAIDSEGRPCAVVNRVDTPRPEPIGATLVGSTESGELHYSYSQDPVTLADHPTHRRLLQTRQLLPADEETARLVGVPFEPVTQALEAARHQAAERHMAETGEASPHLIPVLPTPKAPPVKKESDR